MKLGSLFDGSGVVFVLAGIVWEVNNANKQAGA